MATSVVAAAKLDVAKDKCVSIPKGWALDKDGNPTVDPWQARILMPIAGSKGSGLSIMFECLASLMVNNPKLEPTLKGEDELSGFGAIVGNPDRIRRHIQNSVVAAINISTFTDVEDYKEHVDSIINGLKALPKAEGFSEIFVPGEPEWRAYDKRSRDGIPLPEEIFRNLQVVAERFGIKLPPSL